MFDERRPSDVQRPREGDGDGDDDGTAVARALFAAADRHTAQGILHRAGHKAVPLLPRLPLVAVLIAVALAMPAPGAAQSGVRATASATVRILPSSVRLSDGAVTVERGRSGGASDLITMTPPPVMRVCDAGADGAPCRMLVVDLP